MTAATNDSGPGSADRSTDSDRTSPFDKGPRGNINAGPDRNEFSSQDQSRGESGETRREAGSIAEDSMKTVQGLAQSMRAQASDLVSNIGQELGATAEANVASGANALRSFAKAMDTAAQELESQSPAVARRIRDAAAQVESFTDGISNRSLGELVTAATDLARRQPTYFIAGAVLGGFALARFIKSSSSQSGTESSGASSYGSGSSSYDADRSGYGGTASRRSTEGPDEGMTRSRNDIDYGISGDENVSPSTGRGDWAR
jgi:hypothetical protein